MILYIIRHGRPDYKTDTLLPEGIEQAELVGKRLNSVGIDRIFSSPMGRAIETAQPLSRMSGLPVVIEDWATETDETCMSLYPYGTPHNVARLQPALINTPRTREIGMKDCFDLVDGLNDGGYQKKYEKIAAGVDGLLSRLGYERTEDGFYDPVAPNGERVALFCHVGMMRMLLSHLLNVPMQYLASTVMSYFTGVTVLEFAAEKREDGIPCLPYLLTYGDVGHLHAGGQKVKMYITGTEY